MSLCNDQLKAVLIAFVVGLTVIGVALIIAFAPRHPSPPDPNQGLSAEERVCKESGGVPEVHSNGNGPDYTCNTSTKGSPHD